MENFKYGNAVEGAGRNIEEQSRAVRWNQEGVALLFAELLWAGRSAPSTAPGAARP